LKIEVNGKECIVKSTLLKDLLVELGNKSSYIAVAKNGKIVPRSARDSELVSEDDSFEIMSPVGGG